jgi:para-aminobenzoate synthetase component I
LAERGPVESRTHALACTASTGQLLAAIDGSAELDTTTLACLSGDWPAGRTIIAWAPHRTVPDVARADGSGWIGWQAFDPGLSWWGQFDTVLISDEASRWAVTTTSATLDVEGLAARVDALVASGSANEPGSLKITDLTMTERDRHLAAVEHAISAIRAGSLYQVNICARIHAQLHGTPRELFVAGVETLGPSQAAFIRTPQRTVVSFSPERFLVRHGRQVLTAPIKGTRLREGSESSEVSDTATAQAAELQHSVKDRAENIMIVDLMRNDLSQVSVPGSVSTPSLLQVVPAPGVWHLVSEVKARLLPGLTDSELVAATFPPGSVTGAPKHAALQLIQRLEAERREVFTGTIGYLGVAGGSALNVAIRTFEFTGRSPEFALGVGGGITADSVPMQEWQECLVKAAPLLALGGVGLDPALLPPPEAVDHLRDRTRGGRSAGRVAGSPGPPGFLGSRAVSAPAAAGPRRRRRPVGGRHRRPLPGPGRGFPGRRLDRAGQPERGGA